MPNRVVVLNLSKSAEDSRSLETDVVPKELLASLGYLVLLLATMLLGWFVFCHRLRLLTACKNALCTHAILKNVIAQLHYFPMIVLKLLIFTDIYRLP